jgi:hypothetical protein
MVLAKWGFLFRIQNKIDCDAGQPRGCSESDFFETVRTLLILICDGIRRRMWIDSRSHI